MLNSFVEVCVCFCVENDREWRGFVHVIKCFEKKKKVEWCYQKNSRSYITLSKGVILATILEMIWLVIGSCFVLVKRRKLTKYEIEKSRFAFYVVFCFVYLLSYVEWLNIKWNERHDVWKSSINNRWLPQKSSDMDLDDQSNHTWAT